MPVYRNHRVAQIHIPKTAAVAIVNTVYAPDFEWFGYERVETVAG